MGKSLKWHFATVKCLCIPLSLWSSMNKNLHLEMLTAGTDALANTTQEAIHGQNNNALSVNVMFPSEVNCWLSQMIKRGSLSDMNLRQYCLDFMPSVTIKVTSYSFLQDLILLQGTCRVADCVPDERVGLYVFITQNNAPPLTVDLHVTMKLFNLGCCILPSKASVYPECCQTFQCQTTCFNFLSQL